MAPIARSQSAGRYAVPANDLMACRASNCRRKGRHHSSGEADFDGLPGDELPSREAVRRKLREDAPSSPEKSTD